MAEEFDPAVHSRRRLNNPLTGECVRVSDQHRMKHPWKGQASLPEHDPDCYLCLVNQLSNGQQNGEYEHTKIFLNDYTYILPPPHHVECTAPHPILASEPVPVVAAS